MHDRQGLPSQQTYSFASPSAWLAWLVLLLLVSSRVLLVLLADPLPGDDGNRYLQEAANMWTHHSFSDHVRDAQPTAHDLPLFPLLLAGLIAIFKDPLTAAKVCSLINCLFFGVAAIGVYTLSRRLTHSRRIATSAMLIMGCFPGSYPYSVFYMPESLFLALFVWTLVSLVAFLQTGDLNHLRGSFLLWGLGILAKPIALLFGLVLAGMVIVFHKRDTFRRHLLHVAFGLLLGCAFVVPWVVRNHATFGVAGLSSITGTNPFYCNYLFMLEDMHVPDAREVLTQKEAKAFAAIAPEKSNPMVRAAALGQVARKEIAANALHYARTVMKRHPALYTSTGAVDTLRLLGDVEGVSAMEKLVANRHAWRDAPLRVLALMAGSWLLLAIAYALAVCGVVKLARRRAWLPLALIVVTLAYFALLIGPVISTRYRFVMLPALSLAAAIGLHRLPESRTISSLAKEGNAW